MAAKITLWPDWRVLSMLPERALAMVGISSFLGRSSGKGSKQFGDRDAGLLGIEPDRFLAADNAIQFFLDPCVDLGVEIRLVFAEKIPGHDGCT